MKKQINESNVNTFYRRMLVSRCSSSSSWNKDMRTTPSNCKNSTFTATDVLLFHDGGRIVDSSSHIPLDWSCFFKSRNSASSMCCTSPVVSSSSDRIGNCSACLGSCNDNGDSTKNKSGKSMIMTMDDLLFMLPKIEQQSEHRKGS